MAIERSGRRAAWRLGSVLAAVAGSMVVAVVATQRRRSPPADGATPVPTSTPPLAPTTTGTPAAAVAAPPAPVATEVPEPVDAAVAPPAAVVPVAPEVPEVVAEVGAVMAPPAGAVPVATDVVEREPAPELAGRPGGGRRRWAVAVAAGVVGVVAVVAIAVLGGGDGDGRPVAATTTAAARPTTTAVADLSATDAFTQAAQRLRSARSFSYTGTSQATDVSPVRPGLWLAVDQQVAGEVDLAANRTHEIGRAPNGRVTETVSDGTTVWSRLADDGDALADRRFRTVGRPDQPDQAPVARGADLLPTWLEGSVDRQDLTSSGSTRQFQAQLPADVLGVIVRGADPVAAELRLTLDAAGNPTHLDVTVPDGPTFHLAYDLTQLGAAPAIVVPTPG